MSTNPFAVKSTLPYELPPLAAITDSAFGPAFDQAMEENKAEISAILESGDPTFENTILALEKAGEHLGRVAQVFFNKHSADTNDAIDALYEEYSPKLTAHGDSITLNPALFARINRLFEARNELNLDAESLWLLERYHREYSLAGAGLDDQARAELMGLNEALAALEGQFSKNVLSEGNDLAVVVATEAELAGLSKGEIAAAKLAADERGLQGKYLITLVNFSGHPLLARLENRELRKTLYEHQLARASRGNDQDNSATVVQMVKLRAERARLLGFESHAHAVTADETAGSPKSIHTMLSRIAPRAVANAKAEAEKLQTVIDAEQAAAGIPTFEIAAWDWDFYAEKVRLAEYNVDTAAMKPYFELGRVLNDGVFFAASQLFGVTFAERPDLIAYHPEAKVWEVKNNDGSGVGLFIGDFYTRDSKHGGAWMNSFVDQSRLNGTRAIVVNNLNLPKPAGDDPTLLTLDEVTTLFHEFGHALHGLFSDVHYPHFSGTNVHRDFVEFPSQVNEMWIFWPEVLANYARHYATGEAMPQEWIDNLKASEKFNEGYATTAYLAAAVLDLAWHELTLEQVTSLPMFNSGLSAADLSAAVSEFEANALASYGLDFAPVPSRYLSRYFSHIFAGGYSAGYYGYIWSEILDADTVNWFKENGGLNAAAGKRFRELLLARGGSEEAMAMYRNFRGRDAQIEPLLERRGLI
jgi:peptidyl-dipeptidase Dcp